MNEKVVVLWVLMYSWFFVFIILKFGVCLNRFKFEEDDKFVLLFLIVCEICCD